MRALLVAVLLAVPAAALAQNPANFPDVSVCDLRADADDDCRADAAVTADTVCVSGIVIMWKQFGTNGPGAIFDPASGCCVSVFDIFNTPNLAPGTVVEVCGWMGQFNGLDEIVDNPALGSQDPLVTDLGTTDTFPCTAATADQLKNFDPFGEAQESCCVTICGQFVSAGNFPTGGSGSNQLFVDAAGDTCVVRVDVDTDIDGTPIPVGDVTVTGVLGQFDAGVFCTGYQLLPRSTSDLSPGTCVVAVEAKPWSAVKQAYRED